MSDLRSWLAAAGLAGRKLENALQKCADGDVEDVNDLKDTVLQETLKIAKEIQREAVEQGRRRHATATENSVSDSNNGEGGLLQYPSESLKLPENVKSLPRSRESHTPEKEARPKPLVRARKRRMSNILCVCACVCVSE